MEKKYDGTVQSLANKSRHPHKHPKQHTEKEKKRKEIKLIQNKYQRHKVEHVRSCIGKLQQLTQIKKNELAYKTKRKNGIILQMLSETK